MYSFPEPYLCCKIHILYSLLRCTLGISKEKEDVNIHLVWMVFMSFISIHECHEKNKAKKRLFRHVWMLNPSTDHVRIAHSQRLHVDLLKAISSADSHSSVSPSRRKLCPFYSLAHTDLHGKMGEWVGGIYEWIAFAKRTMIAHCNRIANRFHRRVRMHP